MFIILFFLIKHTLIEKKTDKGKEEKTKEREID